VAEQSTDFEQTQTRCPQCESQNIEALADRAYENRSGVRWFSCLDCHRMWQTAKATTTPQR